MTGKIGFFFVADKKLIFNLYKKTLFNDLNATFLILMIDFKIRLQGKVWDWLTFDPKANCLILSILKS